MTSDEMERIRNPSQFYTDNQEGVENNHWTHEIKAKVISSVAYPEKQADATTDGMESGSPAHEAQNLKQAPAELGEAKIALPSSQGLQTIAFGRCQKILVVATFDQNLNSKVTKVALDMAVMANGTVSLLSVVRPHVDVVRPATGMPMAATPSIANPIEIMNIEDRKALLNNLGAMCAGDNPLNIEVRVGFVEAEIIKYVEELGADLIVVGAPVRSWMEGLFNPSIDRIVTKIAPCPVLVVPEAG